MARRKSIFRKEQTVWAMAVAAVALCTVAPVVSAVLMLVGLITAVVQLFSNEVK